MTSLAEQTTPELGGRWSILSRQKNDHQVLDRLLEQVTATTGEQQQEALNRLCRLTFSHAFAEEAVLWPALRRSVPDGEQLTARVEEEHQEITELIARLEEVGPGDPERPQLIDRAVTLLRQDARDEEDELLPRLQDALTSRQLRRLGVTWELVRRSAPTRAHPIVARRPPGNVLAALPLSFMDRTRDVLDHAGRRMPGAAARAMRTASRGLAAGARAVEKLPPLRHGERPETHVATDTDQP
jgi:hypothetical protein